MRAPNLQTHLLIVDDDDRLLSLADRYLTQKGYICSTASDAREATDLLEMFRFGLIIMDVMMPELDGIQLTTQLRESIDTPIIFLSAKDTADDRIAGLRAGGDDYMTKPYEPEELVARIESVLRRSAFAMESLTRRVLQLGEYHYDAVRKELIHGSTAVHLTTFEASLMARLAETPGQVVRREDLITSADEVEPSVNDRAIDVRVSRLRQKFETEPRRPRYLRTIRGEGYMLIPD